MENNVNSEYFMYPFLQ